MKPSSSKSPTIVLALLLVTTLLALQSCKCLDPVTTDLQQQSGLVSNTASHDTVVLRDSIYIKEILRGDTVYLTRIEYRDRWRTRLVHDTIRDTQYITKKIEHPPRKYVPKFYKWCTGLLFVLVIIVLLIVFLKIRNKWPLKWLS